jgi:hypothetical protein
MPFPAFKMGEKLAIEFSEIICCEPFTAISIRGVGD